MTISILLRLLFSWCAIFATQASFASICDADDHELKVSGKEQCLVMRRFGETEPDIMLVWLHGDVSSGGPANYHFPFAEKSAADFAAQKALAIALVRPGYPDGNGNVSTVSFMNTGRADHHTKDNITEVGAAIERLRNHYKPKTVIAIGHSGGAATSAVLLGLKPGLIDAAVLIACPCDLTAWRTGKRPWNASENALRWVEHIEKEAKVISLTGALDDNTFPSLARRYTDALTARGIHAEFRLIENENHNGAFRSAEVHKALGDLVERTRQPATSTPQ